ncbi:hypothetical protein [Hymenobacter sp. HDW8]|uniref:hypothetical protein n=1 Tax=Hymenobacter sp. HDW8 TaxID=2714932 RepID=UPI00140752AD|nr:hypothetical protein [Hymenobacter sp. HDW8]QIL75889.1 hypothetical protein G7064_08500 [Hymenobacter sp. HDW8]
MLSSFPVTAQLDNHAFNYSLPIKPEYEGQLRVAVQGFLFTKDNEYFNKIDEGRTYYGTQLAPRLVYFPSANIRLEAGIFLYKDYGTSRLRQVRPVFTAKYQNGPHSFLFGNIEGHLQHDYIEPLFDFERVMTNRLEEGMQYKLQTDRVKLDAWVDWQRQQYRFSNFQEQVAGGLTSEVTAYQDSAGWRLGVVPLQFLAMHRGGKLIRLRPRCKPYSTSLQACACGVSCPPLALCGRCISMATLRASPTTPFRKCCPTIRATAGI